MIKKRFGKNVIFACVLTLLAVLSASVFGAYKAVGDASGVHDVGNYVKAGERNAYTRTIQLDFVSNTAIPKESGFDDWGNPTQDAHGNVRLRINALQEEGWRWEQDNYKKRVLTLDGLYLNMASAKQAGSDSATTAAILVPENTTIVFRGRGATVINADSGTFLNNYGIYCVSAEGKTTFSRKLEDASVLNVSAGSGAAGGESAGIRTKNEAVFARGEVNATVPAAQGKAYGILANKVSLEGATVSASAAAGTDCYGIASETSVFVSDKGKTAASGTTAGIMAFNGGGLADNKIITFEGDGADYTLTGKNADGDSFSAASVIIDSSAAVHTAFVGAASAAYKTVAVKTPVTVIFFPDNGEAERVVRVKDGKAAFPEFDWNTKYSVKWYSDYTFATQVDPADTVSENATYFARWFNKYGNAVRTHSLDFANFGYPNNGYIHDFDFTYATATGVKTVQLEKNPDNTPRFPEKIEDSIEGWTWGPFSAVDDRPKLTLNNASIVTYTLNSPIAIDRFTTIVLKDGSDNEVINNVQLSADNYEWFTGALTAITFGGNGSILTEGGVASANPGKLYLKGASTYGFKTFFDVSLDASTLSGAIGLNSGIINIEAPRAADGRVSAGIYGMLYGDGAIVNIEALEGDKAYGICMGLAEAYNTSTKESWIVAGDVTIKGKTAAIFASSTSHLYPQSTRFLLTRMGQTAKVEGSESLDGPLGKAAIQKPIYTFSDLNLKFIVDLDEEGNIDPYGDTQAKYLHFWGVKTYYVNVSDGTFKDSTDTQRYVAEGDDYTVVADSAPTGKKFDGWYIGSTKVSGNAQYTGTASGDGIQINLTAKFVNLENVTVNVTGGGKFSDNSISVTVLENTDVTVRFSDYNVSFKGWRWQGTETILSTDYSYTFKAKAGTIEAVYVDRYTIKITDGNFEGYNSIVKELQFEKDASVTVNAPAAPTGKVFAGWSDGTSILSTNAKYTFTATKNITLTPTFTDATTQVTVTVVGGTIQGQSGTSVKVSAGTSVTVIAGAAPSGKVFAGWSDGANIVSRTATYSFAATANVTLTATYKGSETDIGGIVTDKDDNPVASAAVTVRAGSKVYGTATTDSNGQFVITVAKPGIYNIVVEYNGITVTKTIDLTEDSTNNVIKFPSLNLNSILDVKNNAPEIVVDGLNNQFLPEDEALVDGTNKSVVVKMEIAPVAAGAEEQKLKDELANYKGSLILDFKLSKAVKENGSVVSETQLEEVQRLLTIRIPLGALSGKHEYAVFRMHGGELKTIPTQPNIIGEYYELNADKTMLIVHAASFSQYAVAFKDAPGGDVGGDDNNGGNGGLKGVAECGIHFFTILALLCYVAFVIVWYFVFQQKRLGFISLIVCTAFGLWTMIFTFNCGCGLCVFTIILSWIALILGVLMFVLGKKTEKKLKDKYYAARPEKLKAHELKKAKQQADAQAKFNEKQNAELQKAEQLKAAAAAAQAQADEQAQVVPQAANDEAAGESANQAQAAPAAASSADASAANFANGAIVVPPLKLGDAFKKIVVLPLHLKFASKAAVAEYLVRTYNDVEVNRRDNFISTGLPLADTHYASKGVVRVAGKEVPKRLPVCFAYVYELSEGKLMLLLRLDKEYVKELRNTHKAVYESAYPRFGSWYTVIVDESFTSDRQLFDILDRAKALVETSAAKKEDKPEQTDGQDHE